MDNSNLVIFCLTKHKTFIKKCQEFQKRKILNVFYSFSSDLSVTITATHTAQHGSFSHD